VANGQAALVLKALQAANVALYGGPRAAAAFNVPLHAGWRTAAH